MNIKPNVLFMMTDHQRADTIGMIQCGREVTPNLNKLLRESIGFTRAYTTCPLCVPARIALATGLYPTHNQVVYNDWKGETGTAKETIHTLLKLEGYKVGYVGVDHIKVKPDLKERGLDYFINQEDYVAWMEKQNITTEKNKSDVSRVLEKVGEEYIEKKYSNHHTSLWTREIPKFKDYYFVEKGLEFLEGVNKDEAFALFMYLWAPHPPLVVPEPYASMYNPNELVLPKNIGIPAQGEPELRRKGIAAQLAEGVSLEEWKKAWAAHLGLTTMADELLGKLINRLEEKGELENTIIVFTVDHGDSLGQHKMYQKMEMYEEMIKIPLIMKIPGYKAEVIDTPVSHLDIVPTLCEVIGISKREWDGESLIEMIKNKEKVKDRSVFAQYSGNPGYGTIRRCVVTRNFKYTYDSNHEHELYDLNKDLYEENNIAGNNEYKEVVENLFNTCKTFHMKKDDYFRWNGV